MSKKLCGEVIVHALFCPCPGPCPVPCPGYYPFKPHSTTQFLNCVGATKGEDRSRYIVDNSRHNNAAKMHGRPENVGLR